MWISKVGMRWTKTLLSLLGAFKIPISIRPFMLFFLRRNKYYLLMASFQPSCEDLRITLWTISCNLTLISTLRLYRCMLAWECMSLEGFYGLHATLSPGKLIYRNTLHAGRDETLDFVSFTQAFEHWALCSCKWWTRRFLSPPILAKTEVFGWLSLSVFETQTA